MISRLLHDSVKLSGERAYQIAHKAGLHPSTLSRLINGIEQVKAGDKRVITVGRILGIPANQCFESEGRDNED